MHRSCRTSGFACAAALPLAASFDAASPQRPWPNFPRAAVLLPHTRRRAPRPQRRRRLALANEHRARTAAGASHSPASPAPTPAAPEHVGEHMRTRACRSGLAEAQPRCSTCTQHTRAHQVAGNESGRGRGQFVVADDGGWRRLYEAGKGGSGASHGEGNWGESGRGVEGRRRRWWL